MTTSRDEQIAYMLRQQLNAARAELKSLRMRGQMTIKALQEMSKQMAERGHIDYAEEIRRALRIMNKMRED